MASDIKDAIQQEITSTRPSRDPNAGMLFRIDPDWKKAWWGMPSFSQDDAMPSHKIVVNFMTFDDVRKFAEAIGIKVTPKTSSCWYPKQTKIAGQYMYDGPKTDSRYPICIPSKGRAKLQKTGRALERLGVTHRFFVEETEYDEYCAALGEQRVVKMPFHDLGQGSIPARNFIWEWAKERGCKRHWTVDDNILEFRRTNFNRRIAVRGGGYFRAMEDFVDRYENIAMAGPHEQGFVPDRMPNLTPFLLNSRVYSCILLDTSLPHRWRGRYNEDTDLSLRLLKDGYVTCLFRALCMHKYGTAGSKNGGMKGGNTDHVYNTGDHRKKFAESLVEQHKDCVKLVWRYNRWHHLVDYSAFEGNTPIMRADITPRADGNEYEMRLSKIGPGDDSEAVECENDDVQNPVTQDTEGVLVECNDGPNEEGVADLDVGSVDVERSDLEYDQGKSCDVDR